MYETLNEDLKIDACNLCDLTADQVSRFLQLWEEGAKIGSLTVFCDENNNLVLNKDHGMYDSYRELAELYMGGDDELRKQIEEKLPDQNETLQVMENCLKWRQINKELFRAQKNTIKSGSWNVLDAINKHYNSVHAVTVAFRYGVMQGKRIARAKKKNNF